MQWEKDMQLIVHASRQGCPFKGKEKGMAKWGKETRVAVCLMGEQFLFVRRRKRRGYLLNETNPC